MRHRTLICAMAVAGLSFAATPALSQWSVPADFRVLRTVGPSASRLPPGTALSRTARLRLERGDSVHLLGSGGTRVLRGPGEFRLDRRTFNPPRRPAEVRRIIAGYRDEGPVTNLWILWTADENQFGPSYSGSLRFCTPYPDRIIINAWSPITLSAPHAESQRFAFDREVMSWGAFELWRREANGPTDTYLLQGSESGYRLSVTVVALPSVPVNVMAAAELLARHDCRQQLEYLAFWVGDAVFDSEMEPADGTPMPRGRDSGWVQNNHFECLLVEPDKFFGRAYREEEPCTGEPERDLTEMELYFPAAENGSTQPRPSGPGKPD